MPLVDLDPGGGQSDTVDVFFTDGPLLGNTQWIIEWRMAQLRQLLEISAQGQTHIYKLVANDGNVPVVVDFKETLP
jgi:hypothetical protein